MGLLALHGPDLHAVTAPLLAPMPVIGMWLEDAIRQGLPTEGLVCVSTRPGRLGPIPQYKAIVHRECPDCHRAFLLVSTFRKLRCNPCQTAAIRRAWAIRKRRERSAAAGDRSLPCDHCGATFTPERSTARYCSTRCRVAAHRAARCS